MKTVFIALIALVLALSLAMPLFAQAPEAPLANPTALKNFNNYINSPVSKTTGAGFDDSFSEKMGNGILNAATAWTDVPKSITEVSEKENIFTGATVGLGVGVVNGVARGVCAAYDMASFGFPPYDKPLVEPEYKSNDTNKELKIEILKW